MKPSTTTMVMTRSSPLPGASAGASEAELHSLMTASFVTKAPGSESWLPTGSIGEKEEAKNY